MHVKSLPVKFKTSVEDGLKEGEFLVYPSTFTRTPDSYGDVVAKGAFLKGIAKRKAEGTVLPGLFGHRMDDPHMFIASAIDEGEDEHGWWVKGVFDLEDATAAKVYRLVKSGRIRELSFAYDVLEGADVDLGDGRKAYELRDLDVFEFSFVPVGANRDTSVVAVKSAVAALVDGATAAPVIGAKTADAMRAAVVALEAAAASIKAALADPGEGTAEPASTGGHTDVKDEGATGVKSEGVGLSPSRRRARAAYLIAQAL